MPPRATRAPVVCGDPQGTTALSGSRQGWHSPELRGSTHGAAEVLQQPQHLPGGLQVGVLLS